MSDAPGPRLSVTIATGPFLRASSTSRGASHAVPCRSSTISTWRYPSSFRPAAPIAHFRSGETSYARQIGDPICLAYDVSPDRKCAIGAAGRNDDGYLHVEIVDERQGTAWLAPRLVELARKNGPVAIVTDNRGPGASLIPEAVSYPHLTL